MPSQPNGLFKLGSGTSHYHPVDANSPEGADPVGDSQQQDPEPPQMSVFPQVPKLWVISSYEEWLICS